MGVVYEAEQISLKRRVALKVLRFGAATDPEAMQRFQREAETVAGLHHTNIVPIHAVGCEQGVHYYAMQFIEGRSLAAVLDEAKRQVTLLDPKKVARWGLQGAEALAHAHQRGVIHRDVKPSNLLLDPQGTVWLTDFGLARRADELTLTITGMLLGTPRYMSPEQAAALKQPVDHGSDIYSLGATLYELVTGMPLFDADTPQKVIAQILEAEPVSPRRVRPDVPRDLETILLKCLNKEPAQRYTTAQELADDLRRFLSGDPIKARRPTLLEQARRWVEKRRRSTAFAGTAAGLLIVLIAAALLGWHEYDQSRRGTVSLTTDGSPLIAENLDDNDQLAMPAFLVPTAQPVSLPEGEYRLRLFCPRQPQ
jgi:serine/threonine protein kinase